MFQIMFDYSCQTKEDKILLTIVIALAGDRPFKFKDPNLEKTERKNKWHAK